VGGLIRVETQHLLSVTFGSVASLTLAADLQNREKLVPFLGTALVQHRRSLAVLACYEAVVLEQARQVFSRDFIRKIEPARQQALARLAHDLLVKADPRVIDSGLKLMRALKLTDLASGLGLSILLAIPADKLRALQATGVDFVLAAATAAGPARSAEIQCVRDRRDLVLKNWRRQWVRPGTDPAT